MVRIIDNRKASSLVPFEALELGQFFLKDGILNQKVQAITSENNTFSYRTNGACGMSRTYKEDPVTPLEVSLIIDKEMTIAESESANGEVIEEAVTTETPSETPTPANVEDQPGINVVSLHSKTQE